MFEVFWDEMDKNYLKLQEKTKLHCPKGCSYCCHHHDVQIPSPEFIPIAKKIFSEGRLEEILNEIEEEKRYSACVLLKDGRCRYYELRPSLCRLFGVGIVESKTKKKQLSLCKIIKESLKEIPPAPQNLKTFSELHLPLLLTLPKNSEHPLPANIALKEALLKVAFKESFKEKA